MMWKRHLLVFFLAGSLFLTVPACANESGIRGTVTMGPVQPGAEAVDQKPYAPVSAFFTVYEAEKKIAVFESDDEGKFSLALPPGDYTIVPSKKIPIPFPHTQKTQVSVVPNKVVELTISLDTGMR